MPILPLHQPSFVSGELGPFMEGRDDNELYMRGARKIENFLCLVHGGITERPGFEYVASAHPDDRLGVFDFNKEQQYLLVFGNGSTKIYFDYSLATTITTPWMHSDLEELRYTQTFDSIILVHPDYAPRKLQRLSGHTNWQISTINFTLKPYYRYNLTQAITPSATSGSVTLTLDPASPGYFTNDYVGARIRFNEGIAQITSVTSSIQVQATTVKDFKDTTKQDFWEEELWGTHRGYPRTARFHEGRLFFGGFRDAPNVLSASNSNDFFEFDDSDADIDSNAFVFEISTDDVHLIRHLKSTRTLLVFSSDGEFVCDGGGEPITPSNVQIKQQSAYGCTHVQPVEVEDEFMFTPTNNKEVLGTSYDFGNDKYVSTSKTTVAHQMFTDGQEPVGMAYLRNYADTQANYVFVPRADGQMGIMTINNDKQVLAWSRAVTDGAFLDAQVVAANPTGTVVKDVLFVLVQRPHGTFIEALTEEKAYLDHFFVGASGTAKTDWSAGSTLANQLVKVVADGLYLGEVQLDGSGNFTLEHPVSDIVVGFGYTPEVRTMKLRPSLGGAVRRGDRIRKLKVNVDLHETLSLTIDGYDGGFRSLGNDLLDAPLTSFSGTKEVLVAGAPDRDPEIVMQVPDPLGCTILSLTTWVKVGG